MKNILGAIETLERIGLRKQSVALQRINKLFKSAAFDFSDEIRILTTLLNIIKALKSKDPRSITEGLSFPSYTMSSERSTAMYNQEELDGFSKQIVIGRGIPNFIKNFTNHYMKIRLQNQLHGPEKKQYEKIMYELEAIGDMISRKYSEIEKKIKEADRLITPHSIGTPYKKLSDAVHKMVFFENKVKNEYLMKEPSKENISIKKKLPSEKIEVEDFTEEEEDLELGEDPFLAEEVDSDKLNYISTETEWYNIRNIQNEYKAKELEMSVEDFKNWSKLDRILRGIYKGIDTRANTILGFTKLSITIDLDEDEEMKEIPEETLQETPQEDLLRDFIKTPKQRLPKGNLIPSEFLKFPTVESVKQCATNIINSKFEREVGTGKGRAPVRYTHEEVYRAWLFLIDNLESSYRTFLSVYINLKEQEDYIKKSVVEDTFGFDNEIIGTLENNISKLGKI